MSKRHVGLGLDADHRSTGMALWEPHYVNHTLKMAPRVYSAVQVPLFAETFVALECEVGQWSAFLHYKLVDDGQVALLMGWDAKKRTEVKEHTARFCATVDDLGYPMVSAFAWRRAWARFAALGGDGEGKGEARRHLLRTTADWVRTHHDAAARIPGANELVSAPPDRLRSVIAAATEPVRCPGGGRDHRERPCILCAFPFDKSAFDPGPKHTWPSAPTVRDWSRGLESCLKHIRYHGIREFPSEDD